MKKIIFLLACLLPALALSGCGGSRGFREVKPAQIPATAPGHVELGKEVSAATLHFPAGSYVLHASDRNGYYYRAPRKILEHTAAGSVPREGGIFVSKRNLKKLRGYVYWGGKLVHVGNFSRAKYEFRD